MTTSERIVISQMDRVRLLNAMTEYDRKQSKRKFYNPYALGQYCEALQRVDELVAEGAALRSALCQSFNGRLLDIMLVAIGEEKASLGEQQ